MAPLKEAIAAIETEPDTRHIVSVSGGKDSAALAIFLKQTYPQIPAEYVFCDTGCELPETYEYLERLEALLAAPVVRLDALEMLGIPKKPGRRTPFDWFLEERYSGYLPSPRMRWCTRILKIEPFERYIGSDMAYSYIGIRADEDRDGYVAKKPPRFSDKQNIIPVYPFKDHEITLSDVSRLLEESGIGLPDYYRWRSRSGCYFCFYQQIGEWQRLKDEHGELYERAKEYEKLGDGKTYTWQQGRSLEDLERIEKRYPLPQAAQSDGCAICHL